MAMTCEEAKGALRNASISKEERKRRGIGNKLLAREYADAMRHMAGDDGSPPCVPCKEYYEKLLDTERKEVAQSQFDTI